jgi:hypothetical protein
MFTWLNKQGVRSDRGFEVQFTGRFSAEYRQGGRVVTLHVEDGFGGGVPSILIEPDAFERWDGDPSGRVIAADEQGQMIQNFREAVEFQGLQLVVQRGESPHS